MSAARPKVIVRMSSPAPATVGRRRRFPWAPVLALLLLGGLVLAFVAWEGSMTSNIYPGVRIAGVDVGGLTPAQARTRLAPLRRAAMQRGITVYAGDQHWSVTPAALGLRLNLDDRIQQAYALGRESDTMARYGTQLDLALNGRNLSLIGNYDSDVLHSYVQRIAIAIYRAPQAAVVTLHAAQALLSTHAQDGAQLQAQAATALLAGALADPKQTNVHLPVLTLPAPVSEAAGEREVATLNTILHARLHLHFAGRHWLLGAGVIAPAISLTTVVAAGGAATYQHSVNPAVIARFVDGLGAQIDRPVQSADVRVQGSHLTVIPAQPGYHLDRFTARATLSQAILQGGEQTITLPVATINPTTPTTTAARAARQAAELIRRPLALTYAGRHWLLTPVQLASLLAFTPRRDPLSGPQLAVSVDPARLPAVLAAPAATVDLAPISAHFTVQGSRVVLIPSLTGRRIDQQALAQAIAGRGGAMSLPVPVSPVAPALSTAQAQAMGITDLIAQHTTTFFGSSQNRLTNIHAAVRHLDGQLIAPGAVFSFNERIGDITPQGGYVQGINIVDNQDVPGIGGGVCQVAVTLFQTAVFMGLPILERVPHANIVSYYNPIGMDATVYVAPGGPDVKFQNNTGHWLLISFVEDLAHYKLTARFFGADPHFRVVVRGPIVTRQRNGDVDAVFYRTVYDRTGKMILNAHFNSHYVPVTTG